MTRREFFEGAIGAGAVWTALGAGASSARAAAVANAPSATLPPWQTGTFQIHLIHTGVGESTFFIFPDGPTLLLDYGDHAAITRQDLAVPAVPSPSRLAGEWVARYVRRVNPNDDRVDYMETSHWHADHCGTPNWQSSGPGAKQWSCGCVRSGFGLASEQLRFAKAIDRGWPDYDDPIPVSNREGITLVAYMKELYAHLAKRDGLTVEKIRLGARDQIVPLHGTAADESLRVLGTRHFVTEA